VIPPSEVGTCFDDIGALDNVKSALREVSVGALRNEPPSGVNLHQSCRRRDEAEAFFPAGLQNASQEASCLPCSHHNVK